MNEGLTKFAASTSYYFRNYYRSRSFYLMLTMSLLVTALMMYFTLRYVNSLTGFLPNLNLASISLSTKESIFGFLWSYVLIYLPVFSSVFFGSSAISSEIENRTAFHIFPLPISRSSLLISKYLAAVMVTVLVCMIYVLMQAATFLYVFHIPLISGFFYPAALLIIFIFSMTSFAFMLSSIFNKNTYAYISVFLIYFLTFTAYQFIAELLYKTTPFYLLDNAAGIIEKVYVNISLSPFNFNFSLNPVGFGEITQSVLVMAIYAIVSISVSLIIFERKEVK